LIIGNADGRLIKNNCMNSFGKIFRVQILGQSHGDYVGIVIDGCPPGIEIHVDDFKEDIERRKPGAKGTTPRKEDDIPEIISGVFNDKSTGAPITILFKNNNTRSGDYEKQRAVPRPGHADFVAHKKFKGFEDFRGGGHFSGRLTVALVAAGVVAKKVIEKYSGDKKINIHSTILEIGGEKDLEKGLQKAIDAKDSIGGIVECKVSNLPIGLGEPFFDSAESLISHAVFSIPAVKGIEFGAGFAAAKMFGLEHNDSIINADGTTQTNNAGGIVGGITNGNELVFRLVVKPTSSTPKEQQTLNVESGNVETFSVKGRHDLCIALRVPVVLEAVTAMVLADLILIDN
jgi:chorismate synthase